jgi:hypothetical protein
MPPEAGLHSAAMEEHVTPSYRSISFSRSVTALAGKWIVSLCRSSSLKRAALFNRSRMAARPTTPSPPSQPLPSAISGARINVRCKILDYDDGILFATIAACLYTEDLCLATGEPLTQLWTLTAPCSLTGSRSFIISFDLELTFATGNFRCGKAVNWSVSHPSALDATPRR